MPCTISIIISRSRFQFLPWPMTLDSATSGHINISPTIMVQAPFSGLMLSLSEKYEKDKTSVSLSTFLYFLFNSFDFFLSEKIIFNWLVASLSNLPETYLDTFFINSRSSFTFCWSFINSTFIWPPLSFPVPPLFLHLFHYMKSVNGIWISAHQSGY